MNTTTRPFFASFFSTLALAAAALGQAFEEAMTLVPEDAVGIVTVPSLIRLNGSLADMLERSGRSEAVIAGRPVDMLAAQLGLSAAFDEHGPFVMWWEGNGEDEMLVFAVPVADADRFLNANLTRAEGKGEDAWMWDEELMYARSTGKHVLLSGNPDTVRNYTPGQGIVKKMREALGETHFGTLAKADMAIWAGPDALREMQKRGVEGAELATNGNAIEGMSPEMTKQFMDRMNGMGEGLEQLAIAIDADALAMSTRIITMFDPESMLGKTCAGGTPSGTGKLLDLIPDNPFYVAMGVDISGLGGVQRFIDLAKMASIENIEVPSWVIDMGNELEGIQFAAFPSKLGIAMGGIMNDSSLVIKTSRPDMARDLLGKSIEGFSGVSGMTRRITSWTPDAKLRKGGTADEFSIKEEMVEKSMRPEGSRSGDWAMQNMINGLVFGPRGMMGLAKEVPNGLVLTFSRRPDVLQRAIDSASGGQSLASDPVISAMRGWMVPNPDLEAFVDIGRIGKLARQMTKLIPGANGMPIPIPENIPPVGFGMSVGDATVEMGIVVPSEVIGAMVGLSMQRGFN